MMKKKMFLIMSVLLVVAVAVRAQATDNANYVVSEMAVSSFYKLVVNANIDVVLVQNDTIKKAYVEGDQKLVPEISVTVSNGVMTVGSRRQISYRGKVQVNITVKELQQLEMNADAGIVSFDPIHSPKLYVDVNGYCDLHLKTTGKIYVQAEDGYWIKYLNKSAKKSNVVIADGTEG